MHALEYVILAIAIVVLAVFAGGFFLVRGRRGAPPRVPEAPKAPEAPRGGTVVIEEEEVVAPPARAPTPEAPPAPPEIEVPPPSAGRLVRLRARLSRSQNALGKTLLTLLSRDTLDDDAWDEIED